MRLTDAKGGRQGSGAHRQYNFLSTACSCVSFSGSVKCARFNSPGVRAWPVVLAHRAFIHRSSIGIGGINHQARPPLA